MSPLSADSDADLVRAMATGDRQALRVLYNRHAGRVHRFVIGILRDPDAAEDVTNDVFFEAWAQAGRFEARSSVTTWLLGVARFKALATLRRRRDATLDDEHAAGIADDRDDPEISAQKLSKGAMIRHCIDTLSLDHRMVVDLVYYHETTIEDAARILDVNENTVKTRMFYARKRLAVLLTAAGIDRGWP